ncbi:MAG: DUF1501 domain-containing protein [Pseudomonadales bacterium]|nr:DUF1501 domain-containing protein [Pseudomonadales bacterium]
MKLSMNRRRFLGHAGIALAGSTQLSTFARVAHAAPGGDYCAMVCILLAGGADSFNILTPYDDDRYTEYATTRSDLALPQEDLLPLSFVGGAGAEFAVHPGMSEVQSLFDSGDLAFLANIGPLAEPTSRAAYDAGTVELPLGLFSHSDQIAVWQTATAGSRVNTGFAGRVADILEPRIATGPVSMNISMSGTSLFQTGEQITGYVMDPGEGVRTVAGYGDGSETLVPIIDNLLAIDYGDPFRSTYANGLRDAIDSGAELSSALTGAPPLSTAFSDTDFSTAMRQIANVISVRGALGVERQTFFVTVGGWDHHDEVLDNQARMLPGISQGLAEFHAALTELGVLDQVTTFSISDFGRTLTSNGRGSDHGWGGNQFVMGGGVNGGQIFGDYPSLALGTDLDLGRGRFLPTMSTDELYGDLALWFGVAPEELSTVLPNIGRFYDTSGGGSPLGLFA